MKTLLLVPLAVAALLLGACADGIEPDREVRAAGYSPDPNASIPRENRSNARAAGF